MKILLIATSFEDGLRIENLGIGRIASYLKQNGYYVDIKYFERSSDIEFAYESINTQYDLYGISTYNNNIDFVLNLCEIIKSKQKNSVIVLGSKFITSYYEEFYLYAKANAVDFLVLGDGEYTLLDIIKYIQSGDDLNLLAKNHKHIANKNFIEDKQPLSININDLPLPDRQWITDNNYLAAYICDCHGCIGRCSFCAQSNYYNKWTGRSAYSLFSEVESIYLNTKVRLFIFTGGSFEDPGVLGKKKIQEFCNYIIKSKYNVCFRCYLRADSFKNNNDDRELLLLMKKAGFNVVLIGIEAGNEEDLKIYQKRATVTDNFRILNMLKDAKIYSGTYGFIMYNPYSTLESIKSNYEFLCANQPFDIFQFISKLDLYKKTKIHEQVKNDNLLLENKTSQKVIIEQYRFKNLNVNEMFKFIDEHFYNDHIHKIARNTDFISSNMHCFSSIFDYRDLMEELLLRLRVYEEIYKEYFYWLYVKNDIQYCKNNYNKLLSNMDDNDRNMQILQAKFIKKMYRNNLILK